MILIQTERIDFNTEENMLLIVLKNIFFKIMSNSVYGKTMENLRKIISVRLYTIIISQTSFRVNPHSIVCLKVKGTPWSKQPPYLKLK